MFVSLVLATAAALAPPPLAELAIDKGIIPGDLTALSWIVVAFLATALLYWGATYAQTYLVGWIGQRALQDLRIQLFGHLQTMSVGFYSRKRAGVLISRLSNDVEALDTLVSDGIVTLFGVVADADRHRRDPVHARRRAGADHLHRLPGPRDRVVRLPDRLRRRLQGHAREGRGDHRLPAGDALGHPRRALVRAGAAAPQAVRGAQRGEPRREHEDGLPQRRVLPGRRAAVGASRPPGSCFYGGIQAVEGEITIGVLVAFLAALNNFFDPIQQLSQLYTTYQSGMAALDKIFELLDEEPDLVDAPDAIDLPRLRGEIVLDGVTLRLRRRRPGARRRHAARPAGPDRGAGRHHRRRQVDAGQARRPLLRPDRRPRAASTATTCATSPPTRCARRWGSCPRRRSCSAARSARTSPSAGRTPRWTRCAPPPTPSAPTSSSTALEHGYDTPGRRARRPALRRPAPARRLRPRAGRRPPHPGPGRGDLQRRRPHRVADRGRPAAPAGRPHRDRHRPPPLHDRARGPDRRARARPDRRAGLARRAARAARPLLAPARGLARAGRRLASVSSAGGVAAAARRAAIDRLPVPRRVRWSSSSPTATSTTTIPCSEMLYEEFLVAPSKGRFVNGVLKPHAESLGWTPTPRPFDA